MGLLDSLGLDQVESDPNYLPPKTPFSGVIFQSEMVKPRNKDEISHVVTYEVKDPNSKYHGVKQSEWFKIGIPEYEGNALVNIKPTMSDKAKAFYKLRLENLGLNEQQIRDLVPESLVGLNVEFQVRHANGYQNVATAVKSEPDATTAASQDSPPFDSAAPTTNESVSVGTGDTNVPPLGDM